MEIEIDELIVDDLTEQEIEDFSYLSQPLDDKELYYE